MSTFTGLPKCPRCGSIISGAHTCSQLSVRPVEPPSQALVLYDPPPFPGELKACQDALGEIEIHIYESWTYERITKDAARHFLVIADICGWTMEWVEEMREWVS